MEVTKEQPKRLRSTFGWPIGLITMIAGFLFFASGITASHGKPSIASMGFGVLVMAGSFIFGIRPGIMLRADGIDIHNPLRTVYLPWTEVGELKAVDVLVVTDKLGQATRCYAVSGSMRSLTRVQKAEGEVRARMDRALAEGTSGGETYSGITPATIVAFIGLGAGALITIVALLSGLHK